MSHSILYRRLFVRLPDESIIALIEAGDNNVYDVNPLTGHEMRSRDWQDMKFGTPKMSYTREEIAAWLDNKLARTLAHARESYKSNPGWYSGTDPDRDVRTRFGYWSATAIHGHSTHTTTWAAYRGFFVKGVRTAITLEEFVRTCGGLRLAWWEKGEGEAFSSLVRSDVLRSFDALRAAWDERAGAGMGTVWIEPASGYSAGLVADALESCSASGTAVSAQFIDQAGVRKQGYIASLLPLRLSEDERDAFRFKGSFLRKTNIFGLFRLLDPTKDFRQFAYKNV